MSSSSSGSHRAERDRIDIDRKVQLRFDKFQDFLTEIAGNISAGGMFVHSDEPRAAGERFEFECSLADGYPLVSGRAEVVWIRERAESDERPSGMGVRFLELRDKSEMLIRRIVEQRRQDGERTFELESERPREVPATPKDPTPVETTGGPERPPTPAQDRRGSSAPPVEAASPSQPLEGAQIGEASSPSAATLPPPSLVSVPLEPAATPPEVPRPPARRVSPPSKSPPSTAPPEPPARRVSPPSKSPPSTAPPEPPARRVSSPSTSPPSTAPPKPPAQTRVPPAAPRPTASPAKTPAARKPPASDLAAAATPARRTDPGGGRPATSAPTPATAETARSARKRLGVLRFLELLVFSILVGAFMVLVFNQYWVRPRIDRLEARLDELTGSSRVGGPPGFARAASQESKVQPAETESKPEADLGASAPQSVPGAPEPAAASQSPVQSVQDTVQAWARAWSEQRVDDYLAYYAPEFAPASGLSRPDWQERRRDRLLAQGAIRVAVVSFEVEEVSPNEAQVAFTQSYQSDAYRDRVRKNLRLVRIGDGWKIAEEVVIRQLPW